MIMRGINKIRQKFKRVYLTMFKQYILFSIAMFIILSCSMGFMFYHIVKITESNEYIDEIQEFFMASKIVKKDYKSIDGSKISSMGGWIEILDSNKKLIYVIGKKKDSKKSYTEGELIYLLNESYDELNNKKEYYYSVATFKVDKKNYYCIVKVPYKIMTIDVDIDPEKQKSEKYTKKVLIKIFQGMICSIGITIILGLLYAFWTSRKIVKPLKKILEGIQKMISGDYNTRIKFKADNEFADIKDAFNFMVEKIQTSEMERKKVEDLKNQLLVDISHDLKTPTTSIQGYSKALYDDMVEDEKKQKKYLKIIYDKSKRVTHLIDSLHELTKLDNKNFKINKKKQDFCEFIREILAGFYKEIEDKGFQLEVQIPENEIIYEFDTIEMTRAVSNIISNSIKYNPKGTKINVKLSNDEDKINLLISDNGIGIDDELKIKIFEPFTRGDSSRKSSGGTGLGLSIAKKIIEKHGGKLSLNNEVKDKTEFNIELFY